MSKASPNAPAKKTGAKSEGSFLSQHKVDIVFILLIVLVAFAIRYVSLTDAGVTLDEPIYTIVGMTYVDYFLNFDFSAQSWSLNMEHPPAGKIIYGVAAWLFNGPTITLGAFTAAKMASLSMGVLTCVLVYLIGRDFFDRNTGLAAAMILALLPTFIAHTQIAGLESPLALFVTLSIYLYMLAIKNASRKLLYASALAFGLVMATKFNGLLILPVMGLIFILHWLDTLKIRDGKLSLEKILENFKGMSPFRPAIAFCLIAVMTVFLVWPWLWTGIFSHLQLSISHWSYPIEEYFLGAKTQAPIYYYPVYFLVTLPALLFIPLIIGCTVAIRSMNPFKLSVLAWALIPFLYGLYGFTQDGIRYIFFIYPAVALICGFGLVKIADWCSQIIGKRNGGLSSPAIFIGVTAIVSVYLLFTALSVSPYYLDYYNELTGGPFYVQEHKLFELGWWGEGVSECMDWIGSTAKPDATVMMLTIPEDQFNTRYFMHDQFYLYPWPSETGGLNKEYNFTREPMVITVEGNQQLVTPDYVIYNNKIGYDYNTTFNDSGYVVVYQSKVQGAELARVYKRM